MASSKEFQTEGSVTGYDDEDVRGDGRKRKFKPLSAMKKFFTKKKDKKDTVVAVKAKSTTALPSETDDDDDDEDDGGFKAHSKRSVLAGNRSLSEDSIFSSELRGQPIAAFPKAALSEESLPRSAFQSELMSKLNKRRSEYLDDDNDDGLPRSPVPEVTTADVILGEPLKKQLGQSSKTSSNRDSAQSLISVDSSENEEEELFLNKWKSSVPARKSATLPATLPATSSKTMDILDFNSIQKTELLTSKAAKHKMKVKPARKPTRQSMKHRDTSSPTPLPCLNEESPTSSKHEAVKETWTSGKVTPSDEKPAGALTSQAASVVIDQVNAPATTDSKHRLSSINISSKGITGSPLTSPTSPQPPIVASTVAMCAATPPTVAAVTSQPPTATVSAQPPTAAVSAQPPTMAVSTPAATSAASSPVPVETATTPVSPTVRFPPQTGNISDSSPQNLAPSVSTTIPTANIVELTPAPKVYEKKTEENLSLSERGDTTILPDTRMSVKQLSQSQKGPTEGKLDTDIKSRMSHFQTPSQASGKLEASSSAPVDVLPVKVTNPEPSSVTVLKEDYKLKHQIRSKTLPAGTSEQISPKVQRSRSHRIPNSGTDFPGPRDDSTVLSDENIILSSTSVSLSSSLSDTKKPENTRVSSVESQMGIPAGEPSWMNMVRRKKSGQDTSIDIEKVKTDGAAADKSVLSTSAPKSIFTSASYLEKKRGSIETVSFRGRELSEAMVKKVDSSSTKPQSLDSTSQNKLTATELSSSKKETVEVEVSHLGSVRASRSMFDSSSKFVSQRDSVLPTPSATSSAAERIRKFSSSSSAIPGSNSVKAPTNTSHEVPVAAAAVASEIKPAASIGGISHARSGSVKTSLPKTTEAKSSIYTRNGSVKGPSALSATSSSTSESPASVPIKAESSPALKPDSSEASTAASSASSQPSAQHVPTHVAAPPNPSLPSQTSSKIAVTEKPAADIKKQTTPAKVPAWRTNLSSKEVKIEIIENSPAPAPALSSQTSSENLRKSLDKSKLQETTKQKTEGSSGAGLTVETEKTSRRTSKVLDMVKNFQNLQAPS